MKDDHYSNTIGVKFVSKVTNNEIGVRQCLL